MKYVRQTIEIDEQAGEYNISYNDGGGKAERAGLEFDNGMMHDDWSGATIKQADFVKVRDILNELIQALGLEGGTS